MSDFYTKLSRAFNLVLLEAKDSGIDTRDLVIDLITFTAKESAYGHAEIVSKFKFSKDEAKHDSQIFGNIFAKQMETDLMNLEEILQ